MITPHIGEPLSRPRFPVRTNLAVEHPKIVMIKASIFCISPSKMGWWSEDLPPNPPKKVEQHKEFDHLQRRDQRLPQGGATSSSWKRGPPISSNFYRENIENGWFTSGFLRVPYFKTHPIEELGYQRKGIVNSIVLGLFDFVIAWSYIWKFIPATNQGWTSSISFSIKQEPLHSFLGFPMFPPSKT